MVELLTLSFFFRVEAGSTEREAFLTLKSLLDHGYEHEHLLLSKWESRGTSLDTVGMMHKYLSEEKAQEIMNL